MNRQFWVLAREKTTAATCRSPIYDQVTDSTANLWAAWLEWGLIAKKKLTWSMPWPGAPGGALPIHEVQVFSTVNFCVKDCLLARYVTTNSPLTRPLGPNKPSVMWTSFQFFWKLTVIPAGFGHAPKIFLLLCLGVMNGKESARLQRWEVVFEVTCTLPLSASWYLRPLSS